ncbi:MAG: GNAT family N-acetyltransferase [Anaerolineaceae bacterium]|nr:GNAT family N-acetyltransferase [Anaerolineaceae bacterium]
MPILRTAPTIRPATTADFSRLSHLVNYASYVHRHLDWKPPLDWLPQQPFLIAEHQGLIQSALACPTDPPGIAWIRLFCASGSLAAQDYFDMLLRTAQEQIAGYATIAAIALHDWFAGILNNYGFSIPQRIVVLEWSNRSLPALSPQKVGEIRTMEPEDLAAVCELDKEAFAPLWHNSLEGLSTAYRQSAWATVVEDHNEIVGYQISTAIPLSGHLARLAVRTDLRHTGIGAALVLDLIRHFLRDGAWRVTVNTQDDNLASLSLYEKLGFHRTGETFPVFVLQPGQGTAFMGEFKT